MLVISALENAWKKTTINQLVSPPELVDIRGITYVQVYSETPPRNRQIDTPRRPKAACAHVKNDAPFNFLALRPPWNIPVIPRMLVDGQRSHNNYNVAC